MQYFNTKFPKINSLLFSSPNYPETLIVLKIIPIKK